MRFPFAIGLVLGAGLGFLGGAALFRQVQPEQKQVAPKVLEKEAESARKCKRRKGRRRGKKRSPQELGFEEIDERVVLSAADRAMQWRGDAVALPTQDVDFGGGAGGGSLDQSQINVGMRSRQDDISRCIGEARGVAEIAATITVKFLVNGSGKVTKSRVRAPAYLQKNGLLACTDKALKKMSFDQTGGFTVVTVPFELGF